MAKVDPPSEKVGIIFKNIVEDLSSQTTLHSKVDAIDIALEFRSVTLNQDGKLKAFFGKNKTTTENISLKLATRIKLEKNQ